MRDAAFPLAFALLAACIGPQTEAIGSSTADLDELPGGFPPDAIVEPAGHFGWTRGLFQVTADGAATYDIPLWAPAGRAGIEPNLGLHYSSRGGDSAVGVGWSINGLSSITRCGRTRAIDGDDPGPSAIDWDGETFCLDGQRLVRSDFPVHDTRLRPLQNGTESIERVGDLVNPDSFVVHHENGVVYRYEQRVSATACEAGTTSDNRFGVQDSHHEVTYEWLLTRVEDLGGNYMTIEYAPVLHDSSRDAANPQLARFAENGCSPVEWHATALRYTGNEAAAQLPQRSVTLSYDRVGIEPSVRVVAGVGQCSEDSDCPASGRRPLSIVLATSQSLIAVTARGRDGAAARSYAIAGVPSDQTHRRLVTSVRECVGSACREALLFDYTHATPAVGSDRVVLDSRSTTGFPFAMVVPGNTIAHGDVDGNGAEELVVPHPAGGAWRVVFLDGSGASYPIEGLTAAAVSLSDDDGDGRADIIASGSELGARPLEIYSPTFNPFKHSYSLGLSRGPNITPCAPLRDSGTTGAAVLGAGDLLGSGFRQYFVQCVYNRFIGTSPPDFDPPHFEETINWRGLDFVDSGTTSDTIATPHRFQVISLDGSSRTSTVYARAGDEPEMVALPPPTEHGTPPVLNLEPSVDWIFLDVNGDGMTDALDISNPNADRYTQWRLRLNMGGFFAPAIAALPPGTPGNRVEGYGAIEPGDLRVADFNGDGRADLGVLAYDGDWNSAIMDVYTWNGAAFERAITIPGGVSYGDDRTAPAPSHGWAFTQPLDYDGDGMADIVRAESEVVGSPLLTLHVSHVYEQQPDLLRQVTRSSTAQVRVTYARQHMRVGECRGPVVCGSSVLAVATHTDELGGTYTHSYAGPRFDVEGGGWLGFLHHRVEEPPASPGEIRITDTYYESPDEDTAAGRYHPGEPQYAEGSQAGDRYLIARRPRVVLHIAGHAYDRTTGRIRDLTLRAQFIEYTRAPGPYPMAQISAVHIREWVDTTSSWAVPPMDEMPSSAGLGYSAFEQPPLSALTRQIDRTFTYADFGFGIPTSVTEDIPKVSHTVITLEPQPDYEHWLLAQPSSASITSTTPDGRETRRVSSFHWGYRNDDDSVRCPHSLRLTEREPEDRGSYYQATEVARDEFCMPSSTTVSNRTGGVPLVTRIDYDDEHIFPRRTRNQLDHASWVGIDPTLGVPLVTVDPSGVRTENTYDRFGRLRHSAGHGTEVFVSYRPAGPPGRMEVVRTPRSGGEDHSVIDQFGRSRSHWRVGFAGQRVDLGVSYDSRGRIAQVIAPHFVGEQAMVRTITYDWLDRVTRIDFNDGGPGLRMFYKGEVTLVADRRGHLTALTTDAAGRQVMQLDAAAEPGGSSTYTKYTYGPFGEIREVTDQRGNSWTWEHDRYGRRIASHDPDAGSRYFTYDGFDRIARELNGPGGSTRTQYDYDEISRLSHVHSEVDGDVTYQYDDPAVHGTGRLVRTERAFDGVVHDYAYDDLGRLVNQTTTVDGTTYAVDLGYDTTGRLGSIRYPESHGVRALVEYGYDPLSGLPTSARNGGTEIWHGDDYDGQSRLVAETLGNGTHTEYVFADIDHQPWLEQVTSTDAAGHALMDVTYEHDFGGNVTSRTDTTQALARQRETFTYDGLSRLRSRFTRATGTQTFGYDEFGNMTGYGAVTQTYGGPSGTVPHQLTTSGGHPIHTDSRGRIDVGTDFTATYTDFDLPRSMQRGGTRSTFRYDAEGQRVVQSTASATTTTVSGLFERRRRGPGNETDTINVTVGSRAIAQITRGNGPSRTSYIHQDGLGSPTVVTGSTGAVEERYSYTPFGARARLGPTGAPTGASAPDERQGFTSHDEDPELGVINMRGRIYDPSIGRFLSPDPIVASSSRQSWNPYSYVANNPETLVDPSGYQNDDPGGGGLFGSAADFLGYALSLGLGALTQWLATPSVSGDPATGSSTAAPRSAVAPTTAVPIRLDSSASTPSGLDAVSRQSTGRPDLAERFGFSPRAAAGWRGFGRTARLLSPIPIIHPQDITVPGAIRGIGQTVRGLANPLSPMLGASQLGYAAGGQLFHAYGAYLDGDNDDPVLADTVGSLGAVAAFAAVTLMTGGIAGEMSSARLAGAGGGLADLDSAAAAARAGRRTLPPVTLSWGTFASAPNGFGGTVVSSSGYISQVDVGAQVYQALESGQQQVTILSGVHGQLLDGVLTQEASFFHSDVAAFGNIPGVTVLDIYAMTPAQITEVLSGPGTTIGAFCHSGVCLAPFMP